MADESFLFVPYHAGRQSSADVKLATSEARSHAAAVSRQRRDNKRSKGQLNQQNSRSVSTISIRSITAPDAAAVSGGNQHNDDSPEDSSSSSSSPAHSNGALKRRQYMRVMQFSWRAGYVSSDFKVIGGTRTDPFGYVPSTHYGRAVVDYFWQVISPVNQPIYAIFNVTNIFTSYWMELMRHEDYMPAGLAMVGAMMEKMSRSDSRPSREVRANQASAVARLQKKYKDSMDAGRNGMDDIAIITVLALASLARFLGDMGAYETHRLNMREMCVLQQYDSFWVFETEGTPLFSATRPEHIPVYPAFPLSEDLRDIFIKLPAGFQMLVMKGKISVELFDVLGRAVDASNSGVSVLAPGNMNHTKMRKYNDFVEALPCLSTPDSAKTTIEKDICLATLLYCFHSFTAARSSVSLYAASRTELTHLLLRTNEHAYSLPEQECLYWICAVCVDSWRQGGASSPLLPRGVALLPILKRLKAGSASTNVLQKFLHNQELLDGCDRYLTMTS
ncbi:hypothetical protein LTR70_002762 [Exophiala xenobiotica]|uniref:Uncharacterized protein n=1 Tax=Lithohypha guttulata TaxID=1690604 RepID=A0ABR0KKR3_9EURO|nr:hypothetical protein LTR24_001869 [Lithohypha guttulata]KAK5324688.1 hypothetical protein LTR70_002762 [Exophiala xenobiotica]